MTTGQFQILAILLLALAIWRRPDKVTLALALGFVASVAAQPFRHGGALLPFIVTIDALIVLAMLSVWTRETSMRAWSVGFVGLAKTGWTLAFASASHVSFWTFAVVPNCLFLGQVVAAGGMADGVGDWLDDLCRRFLPRRYSLLRNGGG